VTLLAGSPLSIGTFERELKQKKNPPRQKVNGGP
jgi:hypothetical protein